MFDRHFERRFEIVKARSLELIEELNERKIEREMLEWHLWRLLKLSNHGKLKKPRRNWFFWSYLCPRCREYPLSKYFETVVMPTPNDPVGVDYFQCSNILCDYEYVRKV